MIRLPCLCLLVLSCLASAVRSAPADEVGRRTDELLEAAFPEGAPWASTSKGSRESFLAVLETALFDHAEVGPFDLYLLRADGFAEQEVATKALAKATAGLQPLVPVMERNFSRHAGLIGGRRLPIVLTHSDRGAGEQGFDRVVALLQWAEDDYSGWKQGGNPLYDAALLGQVNARTWEVQVFNLADPFAVSHGDAFYEHGLGYFQIAHVVARALRQGAWGMVPPWLAQGLIDELDIEAYEKAWVGGDWFETQTPGWFRPGWSGFLPTGASPPPVVRGPPADLAVTIRDTGDSWQHRNRSVDRHWADLVADRKSEAPASFAFMAEHESFLPRDRALARAALHVIIEVARPEGRDGLLDLLDRVPTQAASGMFDSDPITVVMSQALGGVPEVDALERESLQEMLRTIGKPELVTKLEGLGAQQMLRIPDHREQAEWLYYSGVDQETRQAIWTLILEAEYYQQLYEWRLIGEALDRGMGEAFKASKRLPDGSHDQKKVAQAFWKGVAG